MGRRCMGLLMALMVALLSTGQVWGAGTVSDTPGLFPQGGPVYPPTIVEFAIDVPSISLTAAEAGLTPARLSWRTVGLRPEHKLVLYAFRVNRWEPLALPPESEPLPATGEVTITIEHPLTFGPPTYSLVIADAAGQTLDQRVVIVPYTSDEETPSLNVDRFEAGATQVDAAALAARTARVPVSWQVSGRQPYMHLIFEQVLETGEAVSVELPRLTLWVASQGEGVVAPVFTAAGQPVRLRLRVVDLRDGNTLVTYPLPPIPVVAGVAAPAAAPVPANQNGGGAAPPGSSGGAPRNQTPLEIVSFAVAPETIPRGGTVTVTWDVRNAVEVGVWLVEPGGRLAQMAPSPAEQGTWTVTVPATYVDEATFMLFARSADGEQHQQSVVVGVICPYVYFFDPRGQALSCPLEAARTVQAAYQEFERGFMIWRADTSDIYVFFRDTGLVNRFRDMWMGEAVEYPEEPPVGRYKPDRGFGRVWVDNPQVRAGLGWATNFERGYTTWVQRSGDFKYSRLYLTLPDGTVIYLIENTWKVWGAP
ncbi:MAG: hypothetical protein ACUVSU_01710 [Aggregatilineaceae bacterium]